MINLLLSLLLLSWAPPCAADAVCRCIPFTTAESLERADAVFAGTVVSVDSVPDPRTPGQRYTVRMRVDTSWKGVDAGEMTFAAGSTSCDMRFEPGVRYVIFGRADDAGTLRAGMCTGTRRNPDAEFLQTVGAPARTWPER
jgi:hypothetical protein